jgi:hypothetical protein
LVTAKDLMLQTEDRFGNVTTERLQVPTGVTVRYPG